MKEQSYSDPTCGGCGAPLAAEQHECQYCKRPRRVFLGATGVELTQKRLFQTSWTDLRAVYGNPCWEGTK